MVESPGLDSDTGEMLMECGTWLLKNNCIILYNLIDTDFGSAQSKNAQDVQRKEEIL